jgi:hypothetical protein
MSSGPRTGNHAEALTALSEPTGEVWRRYIASTSETKRLYPAQEMHRPAPASNNKPGATWTKCNVKDRSRLEPTAAKYGEIVTKKQHFSIALPAFACLFVKCALLDGAHLGLLRDRGYAFRRAAAVLLGAGILKLRSERFARRKPFGGPLGNESDRCEPVGGGVCASAALRRCALLRSQGRGAHLPASVRGARHPMPSVLGTGKPLPRGTRQGTGLS